MTYKTLLAPWAVSLVLGVVAPQATLAAPAGPNGDVLFHQRCQSCHVVTAGKASTVGPNLYGVVGRKAASAPVPFNYSAALRNSGLVWNRANLDKYLTAPSRMVPGTRMVIALPDPTQRMAIIDYLARAK
jgi:cytochrome c